MVDVSILGRYIYLDAHQNATVPTGRYWKKSSTLSNTKLLETQMITSDILALAINAATVAVFGMMGKVLGIVPMAVIVVGTTILCYFTGQPMFAYKLW